MAIQIQGTTVIDDSRKLVNWRYNTTEISSNTSAVAGTFYVATAPLTLTLPSSPTVGDVVGFQNSSGLANCVIGANGSNIMSSNTDLVVDQFNAYFVLQYSSANVGWVIS